LHWCQLKTEILDKYRFYLSLDPPKSPLRRGTREKTLVPPLRRGARGDLDLIVKQQSVIGFDVKLTPMPSLILLTKELEVKILQMLRRKKINRRLENIFCIIYN
jgi:hypothetical protein